MKHIEEQALVKENQHGSRKLSPALLELLEFYESVNMHIDRENPVYNAYSQPDPMIWLCYPELEFG